MTVNAKFYCDPKELNSRTDVKTVIQLLDKLKKLKKWNYDVIDTSKITESERTLAYVEVILPSVFNKYKIRKIFGTNRQSGAWFGKEQPALYLQGELFETLPHEKEGKTKTIEEFLEDNLKE